MRIPSLFALLIPLFAIHSAFGSEMDSYPEVPQLTVEGTYLKNLETGEPVVLRGVSYGWHNWWPRFYTKDSVKWLAEDWKVDVVRAAMGIHHEETALTYNAEPEKAVAIITNVIEGALEAGIYVIIDFHSHDLELDLAKKFFADMAKQYGEYPNIIYEIYNEPVHDTWAEVKAYAEEVIDSIRAFDSDNVILVGNPHWDQDLHLVAKDPIIGETNIMYTLHYYAATHGKKLRKRGDKALKKGIPIFISESAGMKADGDSALDYKAWKKWRDWAEKHKISWITWSIADKDETCSMLQKSASSEGQWKTSDLKESGVITRELLRSFKN